MATTLTWPRPPARPKSRPPGGALRVKRHAIPLELRLKTAWAVWRYEQDAAGRWSKPPYQPSGERAQASEPDTWSEFDPCFDAYSTPGGNWDGVSFALDPRWGYVGIDLDHVSEHEQEAQQIVSLLNTYTERTPSGDGLRLFVRGALPEGRRIRDWREFYVHKRFLTVTGQHVPGTPDRIQPSARLHGVWQYWVNEPNGR